MTSSEKCCVISKQNGGERIRYIWYVINNNGTMEQLTTKEQQWPQNLSLRYTNIYNRKVRTHNNAYEISR